MKQTCRGNYQTKLIFAQPNISTVQGGFLYKLNNGSCTIIPYPTVEVKYIWEVFVTSESKIKSFHFFTIRAMVWIFVAVKNRYLNLLAVLKFAKTKNEPKRAKTNNDLRPIFYFNFHNQANVGNSFINGRGFIYLSISKMSFNKGS